MPVVFSFDIGLGSLGIAVRKDNDIVFTQSLLIDADLASIKEQLLHANFSVTLQNGDNDTALPIRTTAN